MMMLETLLDINLALLYSSVDRADLPLNGADTPCIELNAANRMRRRSSLKG